MGNCRDCKYWELRLRHFSGAGECNRVEHEGYNDLAFVLDGDGLGSSLHTRPDFGCILFEQREEEQND